jgi:hypothetical protein
MGQTRYIKVMTPSFRRQNKTNLYARNLNLGGFSREAQRVH